MAADNKVDGLRRLSAEVVNGFHGHSTETLENRNVFRSRGTVAFAQLGRVEDIQYSTMQYNFIHLNTYILFKIVYIYD